MRLAAPAASHPSSDRTDSGSDEKEIDGLLAGLKKTPKDCRTYAEKVCHNPQVQPQIRVQYCKSQVDAVRQVAASARGAEACKSMLSSMGGG